MVDEKGQIKYDEQKLGLSLIPPRVVLLRHGHTEGTESHTLNNIDAVVVC